MPPNTPLEPMTTSGFLLQVPGIDTIGAFAQCSGLELSLEVYEYREGGNNDTIHRLPGRLQYPNLFLSRGLTNEDNLLRWFNASQSKAELKEMTLTLSSGGNRRVWTFGDAFPVRWTGPTFDPNGATVATESLEIAHSGLKMGT